MMKLMSKIMILHVCYFTQIYRKAAFKIVEESCDAVSVSQENLSDFVGKPLFTKDRLYDITPAGVVCGLAWTSMGMCEAPFVLLRSTECFQ